MSARPQHDAEALAQLVEGATDSAVFLLDANGNITSWNKGAELLLGWAAGEMLGQPHDILYAAPDRVAGKPAADLALAATLDKRLREQCWRVRSDGSEFLAEVAITPLRAPDGQISGYGEVLSDATDRMAVQTALERNALHLRSILASIPDAMVVYDQRGTILSFSAAAERLFGYSEAEVVGRGVTMLVPERDREQQIALLARHVASGERIGSGRIIVGLRRNGTEFPIELAVGEASSEGHRIFTGFVRDLTEKQRSELRLKELQSELIHVSRLSAMGTMASTLAHELNQPLTAIANYMQAGRDLIDRIDDRPELRPMLREAVAESGKEALRAGNIVRRLRDFVSHGEVDKHVEDLPTMIEEASRLALLGAAERGIHAAFHLDPAAAQVLVDRVQIQQVIVNLVRNAAEAMEQSPVRELVVTTGCDPRGMVRISVYDTGPGIAPQVAARLFQAFSSTKERGMGLGLSICRTIVEAHGGRIWAEGRPGGGSIFHFTLMGASPEETQ